ncbi:3-dehydroquinate synthase [Erythrobacter sp. R86502]|uniref:3-dehydroquinate synthase n=1 Tax=Erythrobacter sp. R86502 TaxID=3093846 RepID=UPI0036D43A59
MSPIRVELGGRSYDVQVGAGLIDDAIVQARDFIETYALTGGGSRKVPVVADTNARKYHGERLAHSLASDEYEIAWFDVKPGEGSKSWENLERLTDWLLELGVTRQDHVFALGGGVVGDLVGFACAILKRGVGFVQLPTTLLAQVDSSVGGKTAINTRAGKNLIGAFHQPSLVLVDTTTLATLPDREMRAGYAEVLKYGLLGDAAFFAWLETNGSKVLARDAAALEYAICTSIAMKAHIVAADEKETQDLRALLNLGHTFGHALEAETGFSHDLLHGEAVAMGMVLAARYSARRGGFDHADVIRVQRAVAAAGLPSRLEELGLKCSGSRLVDHMRHDKKAEAATLPFLLLRSVGEAHVARDVDLKDVAAFLDDELAG